MTPHPGRLVLITGASAGIGRVSAQAFAALGDRVVAVARSADKLEALRRESESILPIVADVTDGPAMEAMTSRVIDEHGVPDVVIANAGIGLDALFVETDDEILQRVLDVNILGVYRTVRPFVGPMCDRGSGRILLVSSIVGKRGVPHFSGYSASKFALHGIADALRGELWGTGVTVGVVCPASTETDFRDSALRTGPPQKSVRPVRHSAESVARALVSMAASRRRERILGLEAKLMTFVDILAPGLIDWILARALTRR